MQSFKHRNIIRFINSYVHEGQFYSVMECALGGELSNLLNKKKYLSEFQARKIFKQLHEAVKYIHSKDVVHRDIKPNNILFLDEQLENVVVKKYF
jgi:serine/threonine protein kinase